MKLLLALLPDITPTWPTCELVTAGQLLLAEAVDTGNAYAMGRRLLQLSLFSLTCHRSFGTICQSTRLPMGSLCVYFFTCTLERSLKVHLSE